MKLLQIIVSIVCVINCAISEYTDCAEIKSSNRYATSGIYTIQLMGGPCHGIFGSTEKDGKCYAEVYCDMDRFGGGWTVFQYRHDGSVDFYRDWADYEKGFGSLNSEFYAGNKFLYYFARRKTYELLVELDQSDRLCKLYAKFAHFSLKDTTKYTLSMGAYMSGTAGDSLSGFNGIPFSTKDRDNDEYYKNCAVLFHGAWWHTDCHSANLNGRYSDGCTNTFADTINWRTARGYYYSFYGTVMKLRPTGSKLDDPDENFQLCPNNNYVNCTKECQWNPWSPWSPCIQNNSAHGMRKRTRGKQDGKKKCVGPSEQSQACDLPDEGQCTWTAKRCTQRVTAASQSAGLKLCPANQHCVVDNPECPLAAGWCLPKYDQNVCYTKNVCDCKNNG